jgi:hypothetical protein
MKRLAALGLLLLTAFAGRPAHAGNASEIYTEASRTIEGGGGRFAYFWWLPVEYWEACGREFGLSAEEQAKIGPLFANYVMVAVVDARIAHDLKKPDLKSTVDIVGRTRFLRNGEPVEVLKELDPELVKLSETLVFLVRRSLPGLGPGLRLLPLPNVDPKGNQILTGNSPGQLEIEFRFEPDGKVNKLYWHAPFTSIAGAKTCPKGGETLEASFDYCPWHGVKAKR